MIRITGLFPMALMALFIALMPLPSAKAAPMLMGSGNIIREALPPTTELVRRGGRGGFRGGFRGGGRGFRGPRAFRGGYYRSARSHRPYRPYRGYGRAYRPAFYGAPFMYGTRCFIRPARWVWTAYGYQLRPARRVCR